MEGKHTIMAKILIACEESGIVTTEFRKLGHDAWSCDLMETSGGHPEWHIRGDVVSILTAGWAMMIAHPPCTHLSNAGARHLYPKRVLSTERLRLGLCAKDLFMALYDAPIDKICIENPIPSRIFGLPPYSQIIQPYEHGHALQKRTCLWLKNLPLLVPTRVVGNSQSTKVAGNWFNKGGKDRQRNRAKTFPGIAAAMAEQWAPLVTGDRQGGDEC